MDIECKNTIVLEHVGIVGIVGTCWNVLEHFEDAVEIWPRKSQKESNTVKQRVHHDHGPEASKVCRYGDSDQWQHRYLPRTPALFYGAMK